MQTALVAQPLAVRPASAARQTARRALAVRAAQQPEEEWRVGRRSLAALLAAAPVLLPASRALALLPDDDDEELIERAKANRKARLAAERDTEREFKRSGGYVSRRAPGAGPSRGCCLAARRAPRGACAAPAAPACAGAFLLSCDWRRWL